MLRSSWILSFLMITFCGMVSASPFSYEIEVELDPVEHTLHGTQNIQWTNTANEATEELWFHLYLNAFANDQTTFMRGLGDGTLRGGASIDRHWGWTRIVDLRLADGTDLLPGLSFERPDDGNPEDHTVARVLLPESVVPGASLQIEMVFDAKLPRVLARTGWSGGFHLVGQWFPKLGVFEAAGEGGREQAGWNCHQFHPASEFFADFASYRVQMTIPDDFVLGATGIELERRELAEGTSRKTIHTYTAEQVHDFAWCAAPASLMEVVEADFDPARDVPPGWLEKAKVLLGLSASDLELPPMHIRLIRPRTQNALTERMLRGARLGIAWYGLFYGPYPYPQLTVVSPPPGAEEAGGMEYPTFITSISSKLLEYPPLSWMPLNELVTIHEFGHQYFQSMVASNEFEQAWLDEGLNSFAEASCMTAIREDRLVPEAKLVSGWVGEKLKWAFRDTPLRIDQKAWEYRNRSDYGLASYTKTALVLKTLEGILGPDRFAQALRSYYETWRFRHPTGQDLVDAFNDATGEDLGWYFEQAVRKDFMVDWAVAGVRQRRDAYLVGLFWDGKEWAQAGDTDTEKVAEQDDNQGLPWVISVDVVRKGEFVGPLEVLLIFADGREERRSWDGAGRWTRIKTESPHRLTGVVLDPECVWALEGKRSDNYWRDEPATGASRKHLWWAFSVLRLVGLSFTPWS